MSGKEIISALRLDKKGDSSSPTLHDDSLNISSNGESTLSINVLFSSYKTIYSTNLTNSIYKCMCSQVYTSRSS